MHQPNNFIHKVSVIIIVATIWIYMLTDATAQVLGYKSQFLGSPERSGQAANCILPIEQNEISMSLIRTANSQIRHFERNEELTTNAVEKPQSDSQSSRQAPRLNASGHGVLTGTLYLKPETFNSLPDTTHSRLKTQDSRLNLELSTSLITGSGTTLPFHLHTNRLGTVDPNSTNFLNRIRTTGDLYHSDNFKLDYRADLALRVSENSTAFFPELYAGAEYKAFRLDIGRFDRPIGLNNHDLSIGSMMVSRNAVPIPRIMISNQEFTDLPWTNGIIQFKGMYSHGWFTDERYVNDAYLHQKYLYLKVKATESISVVGGIIHNAFWGGTHPTYGRAPQSFDDYIKIVLSQAADPGDNVNPGQIGNKLGNSLAAYEFGIFYEAETYALSITRLFYLEDSVSTRFRSPWDGVWGVNLDFNDQNRVVNAITYEYINTRRQDAKSDQERGRANYYGHAYYRTGWFYENRAIGLPLITQSQETREVDNNIVVGHHIGFSGNLNTVLTYKLLGTYSRNYGTLRPLFKVPRGTIDYAERREDRYSFLLDLSYTLQSIENLSFRLSTAFDAGEFRESSIGGSLGVRYSFD